MTDLENSIPITNPKRILYIIICIHIFIIPFILAYVYYNSICIITDGQAICSTYDNAAKFIVSYVFFITVLLIIATGVTLVILTYHISIIGGMILVIV